MKDKSELMKRYDDEAKGMKIMTMEEYLKMKEREKDEDTNS